jgi:hypothetical protein
MKDRLLIAALVGVGFLATLAVAAVRGELWQSAAPAVEAPAAAANQRSPARPRLPEATVPVPVQAAVPALAASEPESAPETAELTPAATYEQQTAARDRAAAHSARSR